MVIAVGIQRILSLRLHVFLINSRLHAIITKIHKEKLVIGNVCEQLAMTVPPMNVARSGRDKVFLHTVDRQ